VKTCRHTRHSLFILVYIVLIISMPSCDDAPVTVSGPDDIVGPIEGGYDPVYSADGGFVITHGMLDKRYNEITYPATHNSFAGPGWVEGTCENQELTITEQLENGIRSVEFDLNDYLNVSHSCGCQSDNGIDGYFEAIRDFAQAYPRQIVTVRISDLNECGHPGCLSPECAYERINGRLENTGLDAYICNWDATKAKTDVGRCYIPDPWPTLREMIDSGKNVMFFHHRDYHEFNIIDEGLCGSLDYGDTGLRYLWDAKDLEQLCRLQPRWAPVRERERDAPYRLFLVECFPERSAAGNSEEASRNNDGRKLYQLAEQLENEVLPHNRAVNFIAVDYFMASDAGRYPVSVVDACNRLNYERLGNNWEKAECFWELYPYEFDPSKTEYISQLEHIRAEVEASRADFKEGRSMGGSVQKGSLTSSGPIETKDDWWCLPEWAVDNDYFTKWGCGSHDDGEWTIDLGSVMYIDEIAIAWDKPQSVQAYEVWVGPDLWEKKVIEPQREGGATVMWEKHKIGEHCQKVQIRTKDPGGDYSGIREVKIYGPAN